MTNLNHTLGVYGSQQVSEDTGQHYSTTWFHLMFPIQSLDSTTESTLTDVTEVSSSGCYKCKDTIADLRSQLAKLSLIAEEQGRIQLEVYNVPVRSSTHLTICVVLSNSRQPSSTPSAPGPWPSRGSPPWCSPWHSSWSGGSL